MSQLLATVLLAIGLAVFVSGARDYCSGNGRRHSLNEQWEQGNELCECVYPESFLYFWDGTNPSNAIPFCRLNGCPRYPNSKAVVKNGQTFRHGSNGRQCVCRKGRNPHGPADAPSDLYYGECKDGPFKFYVSVESN